MAAVNSPSSNKNQLKWNSLDQENTPDSKFQAVTNFGTQNPTHKHLTLHENRVTAKATSASDISSPADSLNKSFPCQACPEIVIFGRSAQVGSVEQ